MSHLSRRSVLLGGTALVLGACTKDSQTPSPLISEGGFPAEVAGADVAALRQILARRVTAVKAGDEGLFLADLDPSNTALMTQQKMLFANLRQFTFSTFDYVLPPTGEVIVPGLPGQELLTYPVVAVIQFTIDDAKTGALPGEAFQYTLVKKDGRYLIHQIVAQTRGNYGKLAIDAPLAHAPWNTTALKVTMVGNVWLAADASVPNLEAYAAAAEGEAHRIDELWGDRIRYPGSLLFLTRDGASFKTWYGFGQASNFLADIEGFASSVPAVQANGKRYRDQYAGSRVVVNLANVAASGNGDPRTVMRHELAHAITARGTAPGVGIGQDLRTTAPTWAVEGFATWTETLGNPGLAAAWRRGAAAGFTGRLPRSADFYGKRRGANYATGASVFLLAEKLKGTQAAAEFYAQVVQLVDVGDLVVAGSPGFDRICRDTFGLRGAVFLSRWASYVRRGA
jgi:hypothetical protein